MTIAKPTPLKTSALILGTMLMTAPLATAALAGPHHHHHHGHGIRIFLGGGGYGYADYGRSCRWLKLRALETGSPYWWKRYRFCVYG
jgi:hypothetical protein